MILLAQVHWVCHLHAMLHMCGSPWSSPTSLSTSTCPSPSSSTPLSWCTLTCTPTSTTWIPWKITCATPPRGASTPTTSPTPSQEQTISLQEAKVLEALQYDLETPCMVQWGMLWFSAPTSLNNELLNDGEILGKDYEAVNVAFQNVLGAPYSGVNNKDVLPESNKGSFGKYAWKSLQLGKWNGGLGAG